MPPSPPDISVVVITYNEAARIGACLESVIATLAGRRYDAVVVDSASQDRTVEIAARFPVKVVRLRDGGPRRPSIGRFVGERLRRGNLVLFVDGDSVLEPGWIGPALDALAASPDLAAVSGRSTGVLEQPDGTTLEVDQYPGVAYEDPPHLSGSALYRRAALERAGGFNPHMLGHEEPELGARLRAAGFRLQRLRIPMTRHYPKASRESLAELIRRARRGYVAGLGQYARLALARGEPPGTALAPVARHLQFATLLAIGASAALASIVLRTLWPLLTWVGLMALGFGAFALRARSLRKPAYYFAEWAVMCWPVIRGLSWRPVPPAEFAAFRVAFDVVSEGPPPDADRR